MRRNCYVFHVCTVPSPMTWAAGAASCPNILIINHKMLRAERFADVRTQTHTIEVGLLTRTPSNPTE